MKILVCGSRDWTDSDLVETTLNKEFAFDSGVYEVISGMARGADTFGANWVAKTNSQEGWEGRAVLHPFPAEWDKYGKRAGYIRNQQMLDEGKPDRVIAFSDDLENSRGTAMMVKLARKAGIPVQIVTHEEKNNELERRIPNTNRARSETLDRLHNRAGQQKRLRRQLRYNPGMLRAFM